jgi:glycosyltransferase involved in cell wall biosynthesis
LRILVLTHEYPPIGGGGGKVAQDLCHGFVHHHHEVHVLTAAFADLPRYENQDGVIIHRLPSCRTKAYQAGFITMAVYIWQAFWQGIKLHRTWKPDIIHVHFAVPAGAAAWGLSLFTSIPYVLTAHLGDVPDGVPEKTRHWFRWILPFTPAIWKRASKVIAVSEFTRVLAQKYYPVPVEVIYNGVDLSLPFNPHQSTAILPQLVFVGRFQPQKNPVELVRILAEVKEYPWDCHMLGDGPLRHAVESEIVANGLERRIHLHGWVTPEQVIEQLASSDVLIMPSLSEGLPVVGVQAAAMGLALVLSRVGGCTELVENGKNGYLIEPSDHSGFVQAVQRLLADTSLTESFRIESRRISIRFDINTIIRQYETAFTQALE